MTRFAIAATLLLLMLTYVLIHNPWIAEGVFWVVVGICGAITIGGFVWLIWCWAKSFRSDDAADYTNPRGWWI